MKKLIVILLLIFKVSCSIAQIGYTENIGQVYNEFGQSNTNVKFLYKRGNFQLQIRSTGFSYEWLLPEETKSQNDRLKNPASRIKVRRLDYDFVGVSKNISWEATESLPSWENYYNQLGSFLGVHSYNKIKVKNAWEGVDIIFYLDNLGMPKYDFVVTGKSIHNVKIQLNNHSELFCNEKMLTARFGDLEFMDVIGDCYVEENHSVKIDVNWRLFDSHVTLESNSLLDENLKYRIDPQIFLKWATYHGGEGLDKGLGTDVHSDGGVYFCGFASSKGMATSGTKIFQTSISNNDDAYLAKFHKDGGSLSRMWTTYYGDTGYEAANAVSVIRGGTRDTIYITGFTTSGGTKLAKNSRYRSSYSGKKDVFIAKFLDSGYLIWSNYYGGKEDDIGTSITTDSSRNPIIVGSTYSDTGIVRSGFSGFSSKDSGSGDGFVLKLRPSGKLVWSSYYGGTGTDVINDVTIGIKDTICFIGTTNSNYIVQNNSRRSNKDAFYVLMSPTGARLRSYYFGGSGDDEGRGIYYARKTNTYYIAGKTNSKTGIITSKSLVHSNILNSNLGGTNNSSTDGYIANISSRGDTLWSSYYGGQGNDDGVDVVIDDFNYIYLCGTTASNNCSGSNCATSSQRNIIASTDAFKKVRDADEAYVAKFDSKGKRVWSTYFGGRKTLAVRQERHTEK